MAYQQAISNGCDEAVFHRDGIVTECAHSNIHILKNGRVLYTPRGLPHILAGIARAHLIEICGTLDIPVAEQPFYSIHCVRQMKSSVSSSGDFCMRACELDGQPIGGKDPVRLKKLQDAIWQQFLEDTKQM